MSNLLRFAVPFLALSLASLTSACAGGEQHEVVVLSTLSPCTGVSAQMCLNVKEGGAAPTWLYDGIQGFTHRWGVETRLRYTVETVEDPPEDGSSLRYVLDEVVTEVSDPVCKQFDLSFPAAPPGAGWFEASGGGISMVGTAVDCEAAVCADIVARTEASTEFDVTFELTGDTTVPLRVVSVQ